MPGAGSVKNPEFGSHIPFSEMIVHMRNAVSVNAKGKIMNRTRNRDALCARRQLCKNGQAMNSPRFRLERYQWRTRLRQVSAVPVRSSSLLTSEDKV